MTSISDYDAMQAELQALQDRSAEVRQVEPEVDPSIVTEQHQTHEAVAALNFGVDHQMETSPAAPSEDFGENPLIVGQQEATRVGALRAIR